MNGLLINDIMNTYLIRPFDSFKNARPAPSTRLKYLLLKKGISFTKSLKSDNNSETDLEENSTHIDPQKPELDRTQNIANAFKNNRAGIESYYKDKVNSIMKAYRTDSNTGAIDGVAASELDFWMKQRNDLLDELKGQIEDVKELADVSPTPSPSTSEVAPSESGSPISDTGDDNEESFRQDSSDITGEDAPLDFFED